MKTFAIEYRFRFPDGRRERYDLRIDAATLVLLDLFAKNIPFVIEDSLEEIRSLFAPFLAKSN